MLRCIEYMFSVPSGEHAKRLAFSAVSMPSGEYAGLPESKSDVCAELVGLSYRKSAGGLTAWRTVGLTYARSWWALSRRKSVGADLCGADLCGVGGICQQGDLRETLRLRPILGLEPARPTWSGMGISY